MHGKYGTYGHARWHEERKRNMLVGALLRGCMVWFVKPPARTEARGIRVRQETGGGGIEGTGEEYVWFQSGNGGLRGGGNGPWNPYGKGNAL